MPVDMWTIGFADRLRFPASRASSKSGEVLAFAHIPTGTTTNTRIDQKGFDGRVTSASMAIGADIEIRGGYTLKHGSGCRTIGVHLIARRRQYLGQDGHAGRLRYMRSIPSTVSRTGSARGSATVCAIITTAPVVRFCPFQ